ncbi:MAG TPA: hypothetical protein VH877_00840 [Polyangia bacterium]|jgi:WD40 repeat protein|nr:hypothetical protein [Polyangia bacterium]
MPCSSAAAAPASSPAPVLRDRWSLALAGAIGAVAWSPSGRQLAVVTLDGKAIILDGRHGQPLASWAVPTGPSGVPGCLAWSPTGDRLAVADGEGHVQLFCLTTGQCLSRQSLTETPITHLAWAPGGAWLAAATGETAILYQPTSTPEASPRPHVVPLAGPVQSLFWLPGSARLAAAGDFGLHLLAIGESVSVRWLKHPAGQLLGATPSPDGRLVAAGLAEGGVRLWDVETGAAHTLEGPGGPARRVAWGAAGTLLAAADDGPAIAVWALFDHRVVADKPRRLHGYRGQVHGLEFIGAQLFSAGDDGLLRCWRQHPGGWRCTRSEHVGWPVQNLVLTTATRSVTAVGSEGRVWSWQR